MTDQDASAAPEGRSASPADRRRRAVDEFIDLVLQGETPVTPDDIAEQAGVSRATFFRYFSSLDELRGEAAIRVVERFPELYTILAADNGSIDERIDRFVDARLQLHEKLSPLALLVRRHATRNAESAEFIDTVRRGLADQVRRHFDVDMRDRGPARRDDIVTAINVVTSVESWQQFRHSHGRSVAQTRRAWRSTVAGILSEPHHTKGKRTE